MHNDPTHPPFEYSRITDNLIIGTNACCIDHFREELLNQGITADISLEKEQLDAPYGVELFLWLPTADHTPPSPVQIDVGVSAIKTLIDERHTIYIHCKNGHGRAPTLLAAYFITTGMTVDDAIARIKEKRPAIHIEPSQIKALNHYKSHTPLT